MVLLGRSFGEASPEGPHGRCHGWAEIGSRLRSDWEAVDGQSELQPVRESVLAWQCEGDDRVIARRSKRGMSARRDDDELPSVWSYTVRHGRRVRGGRQ